MGLKKLRNTFKKKLINQIVKKGKKQMVEKEVTKSLKQAQKNEKKNTSLIIKQSTLSTTPVFRFVNLTNKMRRKKTVRKIPAFLSNSDFRSSWGLKHLTRISSQKAQHYNLRSKLEDQFSLSIDTQRSVESLGNSLQEEASKEKKYFKYYRW